MRSRLASVTKPIVAAAVVLACRQSPGAWDTPIREHFPELHAVWQLDPTITLTDLLSHTSGIAVPFDDAAQADFGDGDDALMRQVALVAAGGQQDQPRTVWRYGGVGFWLAGAVVARMTGTTFEQVVDEFVIRPAGMTRTGFETPPDSDLPPTGPGDAFPRARRPSGGLWSCVDDLLKFSAFLYADPELVAQLSAPLARTEDDGVSYGLGMFTDDKRRFFLHTGDWHAFHTCALWTQETQETQEATIVLSHGPQGGATVERLLLARLQAIS
ncbi:serine hydrolase domain-containing protein [Kribbella pittospori]|nr:serine hydrolase domain-containing protein [Kribbella pittospori]